jgi:hypothetical protein
VIRYTRPATWPTATCVVVGLVLGLLGGLVGFDIPETVSADDARAYEAHARSHPVDPLESVDHRPLPMVTGPGSAGVYVE